MYACVHVRACVRWTRAKRGGPGSAGSYNCVWRQATAAALSHHCSTINVPWRSASNGSLQPGTCTSHSPDYRRPLCMAFACASLTAGNNEMPRGAKKQRMVKANHTMMYTRLPLLDPAAATHCTRSDSSAHVAKSHPTYGTRHTNTCTDGHSCIKFSHPAHHCAHAWCAPAKPYADCWPQPTQPHQQSQQAQQRGAGRNVRYTPHMSVGQARSRAGLGRYSMPTTHTTSVQDWQAQAAETRTASSSRTLVRPAGAGAGARHRHSRARCCVKIQYSTTIVVL